MFALFHYSHIYEVTAISIFQINPYCLSILLIKYYVRSIESAKILLFYVCQIFQKKLKRKRKEKLTKIDIKIKRISLSITANTASKKRRK